MQFEAQHRYYHEQFIDARFDVIEQSNQSIGRLYVDRRAEEIRIIDIALLPECRGLGIGKYLMCELLEEASSKGLRVTIHVEHNNPAMHLYKRLGFQHIHDEGVYYFMQWDPVAGSEDQAKTAS